MNVGQCNMEVRRIEPMLPKKTMNLVTQLSGDETQTFNRFEARLQCHLVQEVVAVGGRHFPSIISRQEV